MPNKVIFEGEVLYGLACPHKPPTINMKNTIKIKPGLYTCKCFLGDEFLGRGIMWATPNNPTIETFIHGFFGNLYEKIVRIEDIARLSGHQFRTILDIGMDYCFKSEDKQHAEVQSND